jgi:hypothetical protein
MSERSCRDDANVVDGKSSPVAVGNTRGGAGHAYPGHGLTVLEERSEEVALVLLAASSALAIALTATPAAID